MVERRRLVEGLPTKATQEEVAFVYPDAEQSSLPESSPASANAGLQATSKSPLSTRIRADYAVALKRASLERQIAGIKPQTIMEILEEALEPWLKSNGYLP